MPLQNAKRHLGRETEEVGKKGESIGKSTGQSLRGSKLNKYA